MIKHAAAALTLLLASAHTHTLAQPIDPHGPGEGRFALVTHTFPGPSDIGPASTWTAAARQRVIPADPARVRFILELDEHHTRYIINAERPLIRQPHIHADLVLRRTDVLATEPPEPRRVRVTKDKTMETRQGRRYHRASIPRAGSSTNRRIINIDTDLRTMFGTLEPGTYDVHAELHRFFLTPADPNDARPPTLVRSPTLTIEVADLDIHNATASPDLQPHDYLFTPPTPTFDPRAPLNEDDPFHGRRAVIAMPNLPEHPRAEISFPIDTGWHEDPAWGTEARPANTLAHLQRFTPEGTWASPDGHPPGFCGTGVTGHTMRAGERTHITLRHPPNTPGVYRYVIDAALVTNPRPHPTPDQAPETRTHAGSEHQPQSESQSERERREQPRIARFVSLPFVVG